MINDPQGSMWSDEGAYVWPKGSQREFRKALRDTVLRKGLDRSRRRNRGRDGKKPGRSGDDGHDEEDEA